VSFYLLFDSIPFQSDPDLRESRPRFAFQHPAFADVEEKEGFSDYNPFQSGGESPDQKREKKLRRKVRLDLPAINSPKETKLKLTSLFLPPPVLSRCWLFLRSFHLQTSSI